MWTTAAKPGHCADGVRQRFHSLRRPQIGCGWHRAQSRWTRVFGDRDQDGAHRRQRAVSQGTGDPHEVRRGPRLFRKSDFRTRNGCPAHRRCWAIVDGKRRHLPQAFAGNDFEEARREAPEDVTEPGTLGLKPDKSFDGEDLTFDVEQVHSQYFLWVVSRGNEVLQYCHACLDERIIDKSWAFVVKHHRKVIQHVCDISNTLRRVASACSNLEWTRATRPWRRPRWCRSNSRCLHQPNSLSRLQIYGRTDPSCSNN